MSDVLAIALGVVVLMLVIGLVSMMFVRKDDDR